MAAPWKERAKAPATFRGVPFWVDKSELGVGRKTVTFEYPQRDTPFVEDLGRKAREFSIDGYIVGPDYMAGRDALLAAIETGGPGTLVHPYHGTRQVAVTGCHLEETRDQGGVAFFSIQFTETPARVFAPATTIAPAAAVAASADAALTSSKNQFFQRYAGVAVPSAVTATTALRGPAFSFSSLTSIVQSSSLQLRSVLSPVLTGTQSIAGFKRQVDALYSDASSLVRSPFTLATRVGDLFRSLTTLPVAPRLGVAAMLRAYTFQPTIARPTANTATRRTEQVRYDATVQLINQATVITAAQFAAQASAIAAPRVSTSARTTTAQSAAAAGGYDSYEEAVAVRDAILAQLDEQAALAGDEVYPALDQVRTDLVSVLPGDLQPFAHLMTVTPPLTVPSLVLAYQLYGSIEREADLVARNRIAHPGFVRGEQPLQVLADA
jgi:prophage DNA circulation protein